MSRVEIIYLVGILVVCVWAIMFLVLTREEGNEDELTEEKCKKVLKGMYEAFKKEDK